MDQGFRRGFTAAEKSELGSLAAGRLLKAIGAMFWQAIIVYLLPSGSARWDSPFTPALLTIGADARRTRGNIQRHCGASIGTIDGPIAGPLGLDGRELSRNGGYDGYRAALADETAWARTRRPKRCKLANSARLRQAVASKLRLNWSPEQVAGWLKRAHPGDESYHVSHETIYRSLFVQARGVLKKELLGYLRSRRTIRRSKQAGLNGDGRGQIRDIVSIRQRPAVVEDRAVPGHWEGDLLTGVKEQLHRDLGRTSYALRDAGKGGQQGHPDGHLRAHQNRPGSYRGSCISR